MFYIPQCLLLNLPNTGKGIFHIESAKSLVMQKINLTASFLIVKLVNCFIVMDNAVFIKRIAFSCSVILNFVHSPPQLLHHICTVKEQAYLELNLEYVLVPPTF